MRVLLVKPNNLSDHVLPSLGLGYLAAQLRRDHDVDIYDCIKEKASPEQVARVAEAFRADMVGLQGYTFDIPKVAEILRAVRTRLPRTLTCVGGAHITAGPVAAMRHLGADCDYGFAGEGEIQFPRMLQRIESGATSFEAVPGAVWRCGDRVVANAPALVDDLDSLGLPALDLLRPDTYPEAQQGVFYRKFPIAPILTTRGCPYRCRFCAAPFLSGRTLRQHSVAYVRRLVALLYHRYGIREIHIVDDNFTMDIGYAKSVLRAILDLRLDIALAMPNGIRMDAVDDELLELMKAAGVYIVSVAVESGNDQILRAMKKGTTTARIRANVDRIRRHGLDVAGFFILGYPGETLDTIRRTIRFARELDVQRANFFTFVPLPGAPIYEELVRNGEITGEPWEAANFAHAPYSPPGVPRPELLSLMRRGFLRFYLRPRILLRHILAIRSYRHLRFLLRRFHHWMLTPIKRLAVGPASESIAAPASAALTPGRGALVVRDGLGQLSQDVGPALLAFQADKLETAGEPVARPLTVAE